MDIPVSVSHQIDEILNQSDPRVLLKELYRIKNHSVDDLEFIDTILMNMVCDYVSRSNDKEGLSSLQYVITRILSSDKSFFSDLTDEVEKTSSFYAARWQSFSDVVSVRYNMLSRRNPSRIRKMKFVEEIENILSEDMEVPQSYIGKAIKVSASRLSQILSLMETNGLIERRIDGKEKYVRLTKIDRIQKNENPEIITETNEFAITDLSIDRVVALPKLSTYISAFGESKVANQMSVDPFSKILSSQQRNITCEEDNFFEIPTLCSRFRIQKNQELCCIEYGSKSKYLRKE